MRFNSVLKKKKKKQSLITYLYISKIIPRKTLKN